MADRDWRDGKQFGPTEWIPTSYGGGYFQIDARTIGATSGERGLAPGGLTWAEWFEQFKPLGPGEWFEQFTRAYVEQLDPAPRIRECEDPAIAELAGSKAIPPGELYVTRARCYGRYRGGRTVQCDWEGPISRRSGDENVPACPACGGLTEAVDGAPRLRRVQ